MPIYEYECTNCGIRFERHQRISDDPVQVCPECDGQVRRVFHPVGIIFKGSGFYVTDNRRISGGSGRKEKTSSDKSKDSNSQGTESSTSANTSEKSPSKAEG